MLGLGWTEMMVLGVVALIVIGPKDLPVVMNRIGKVAGQIRRMGSDFQRELNKTTGLDEVRNLRNSIAAPLKQTSDEIRKEFNTMTAAGPKPSGVIKPADPNAESVVDEIKAAAGMAPAKAAPKATPKTADQIAAESGFKPSVPAPVSSKADTPGAPRKRAPRKSPVKAAAAPGRPAVATKPKTPEAVPDPAEQKPVPEPARKPRTPKVTEQPDVPALPNEPADSPATKTPRVRAPRKTKPAKAGKE